MEIWAKKILTKKGAFNRESILNLSLKISKIQRAEVAQSVEQGTENPRVGSSILSLGTFNIKGLRIMRQLLFCYLLPFCYHSFQKWHFQGEQELLD